MTEGEKMIWAAVYAQALFRSPTFEMLGSTRTPSEQAVGKACAAVMSLRHQRDLAERSAERTDSALMLSQMLAGSNLPGET